MPNIKFVFGLVACKFSIGTLIISSLSEKFTGVVTFTKGYKVIAPYTPGYKWGEVKVPSGAVLEVSGGVDLLTSRLSIAKGGELIIEGRHVTNLPESAFNDKDSIILSKQKDKTTIYGPQYVDGVQIIGQTCSSIGRVTNSSEDITTNFNDEKLDKKLPDALPKELPRNITFIPSTKPGREFVAPNANIYEWDCVKVQGNAVLKVPQNADLCTKRLSIAEGAKVIIEGAHLTNVHSYADIDQDLMTLHGPRDLNDVDIIGVLGYSGPDEES